MTLVFSRVRSAYSLKTSPFRFALVRKNYCADSMSGATQPGSGKPAKDGNAKGAAKPSGKTDLKILMLHGFTQSGPLFKNKTGALNKLLTKALGPAPFNYNPVLVYPTGPNQLRPSDIPGFQPPEGKSLADVDAEETDNWGWFRRHDGTGAYVGFEDGMRRIAATIREAGGVDGVLGFSQGGAMTAWVAAAMEAERALPSPSSSNGADGDAAAEAEADAAWARELREANGGRPLRFAVIYSGFVARDAAARRLEWLYAGGIQTPTLHFIGSLDTVVDESRSRGLAERCQPDRTRVVVHPGGHYVPVSKEWTGALVMWLREVLQGAPEEEEEQLRL